MRTTMHLNSALARPAHLQAQPAFAALLPPMLHCPLAGSRLCRCNFPTDQTSDFNAGPKYDGETLTIDCGQRRINDIIDARWTGDNSCGKDNIGADVTT